MVGIQMGLHHGNEFVVSLADAQGNMVNTHVSQPHTVLLG